ncbi:MAG TPA: AAA family ATPase [Candidatus Kapabacteria bacterium]|nr:AAA family ATPase [Candidatus Kapabacteria bacterium]
MKLNKIKIHNFRSIIDGEFNLDNYCLLIGENNSGKSTIISALRILYEDSGIKYSDSRDFPKVGANDNESWIEIDFMTASDEQELLKDDYKSSDNILKIRKYFKHETLVKSNTSNIYAYENGVLSNNQFYGAKNISQAKIGSIIFIPEISTADENLKMSGPSPFREMVNFVVNKITAKSKSYEKLQTAFDTFNNDFKFESFEEYSLDGLKQDINDSLNVWGINFDIKINSLKPQDMVKNLVSHVIHDKNLENKDVELNTLGQGLQRHLIYTLIKLSAKYISEPEAKKKDFNPDLTIILFEEPEAFLHPSQQELLNISLRTLANEDNQQIIITTHSPIFISKNVEELSGLVKITKEKAISILNQISSKCLSELFNDNLGLFNLLNSLYSNPITTEIIKQAIKNKVVKDQNEIDLIKNGEEFRYLLYLNSERTELFFSKMVIICEGASEKIFFDYLVNNIWYDLKEKNIYFLDSLGKFNIHRFIHLLGNYGIKHSVLMDSDRNTDVHQIINQYIEQQKNKFTKEIKFFTIDLEEFLGIIKPSSRPDLKPLNIITAFKKGEIAPEKITELKNIIDSLIL